MESLQVECVKYLTNVIVKCGDFAESRYLTKKSGSEPMFHLLLLVNI